MGGSISVLQRNKRNNFLSVDFVMFMFGMWSAQRGLHSEENIHQSWELERYLFLLYNFRQMSPILFMVLDWKFKFKSIYFAQPPSEPRLANKIGTNPTVKGHLSHFSSGTNTNTNHQPSIFALVTPWINVRHLVHRHPGLHILHHRPGCPHQEARLRPQRPPARGQHRGGARRQQQQQGHIVSKQ